jgi:DNA-binding IclR family transcriptional regulator
VRERPGVTVPEAAQAMGAAPTHVYRIAATLLKEGTVRREGRGFVAPGVEGPAAPEQPGEGGPPATGLAI